MLLQWSDKTPHIKMYLMKMFNIFFSVFIVRTILLIKGKKASETPLLMSKIYSLQYVLLASNTFIMFYEGITIIKFYSVVFY